MMLLQSTVDCMTSTTSESMGAMRITGRQRTNDDPDPCDLCRTPASAVVSGGCRDRRLLFCACAHDWLLPATARQDRRGLLHGGTGDDSMGCRPKLPFRQSGSARADGVGGVCLSIWNPSDALVLDRSYSGNAVPRARDDAFLFHFEDTFCPRLPETSIRRIQPRLGRGFICVYDRADERHQHVFHGAGHEGGSWLEYQFQHMGFVAHSRRLCSAGRIALGNL